MRPLITTDSPRIALHEHGALDELPALPQTFRLRACAERILSYEEVDELWLRGSTARGDADRFSDLDLDIHLSVSHWLPEQIRASLGSGLMSLRKARPRGDVMVYEAVFNDGVIVDLDVYGRQPAECADGQGRPEQQPQTLHRYWVSVLKLRKLLFRGELAIAQQGLGYQRRLALGAIAESEGMAVGDPNALTIHALRTLVRNLDSPPRFELHTVFGWPSRTTGEVMEAIDRLNDAVARVEDQPSPLSAMAQALWARRDYLGQVP